MQVMLCYIVHQLFDITGIEPNQNNSHKNWSKLSTLGPQVLKSRELT